MKKVIILLIIVLVGVFFVNILSNESNTQEATLNSAVLFANTKIGNMTRDELNRLAKRVTTEELEDAQTLMRQWQALLKLAVEANKIIMER